MSQARVETKLATEARRRGDAPAAPSVLYAVKQVELAVRGHLDALVQPTGITALQYTALTVLRERDGQVAAELARLSFVTPQSMADMVRALERRGLIARTRDPRDKKRLMINLTPAGWDLLEAHDEAVAELEERMLAGLSKADRDQLRRSLNRARLALED